MRRALFLLVLMTGCGSLVVSALACSVTEQPGALVDGQQDAQKPRGVSIVHALEVTLPVAGGRIPGNQVPEPSVGLMLAAGVAALLGLERRRVGRNR